MKGIIRKDRFATCVPVVPKDAKDMTAHLTTAKKLRPDFIEWRRDYLKDEAAETQDRLCKKLKESGIPFIFTFRSQAEGGLSAVSEAHRFESIRQAVENHSPDYIDVEIGHLPRSTAEIRQLIDGHQTKLILSAHFFDRVLASQEILSLFRKMKNVGADVFKLAHRPDTAEETEEAIQAVKTIATQFEQPVIHVLMGPYGKVSRVFPEECGGSLTYVSDLYSTASGQLTLKEVLELRKKK